MFLTPKEFAKLNEARRLQVERYRTAYFKREGRLPPDGDAGTDLEWLRVKLGEVDACLPVGTLTKWARTFEDAQALSFELNGKVTLRRGSSRIALFTQPIFYHEGNAYRGSPSGYRKQKTPPLDAPVILTPAPGGLLTVSIPDISAELATLKAETTANRKQLAKEKAIAKARKAEREAREALARASDEAANAQKVFDSMTPKEAVNFARRCLNARRLLRATLADPATVPAWLPATFEAYNWQDGTETKEQRQTAPEWREYVAAYEAAVDALAEYKPRVQWVSYAESLAREKGMSLAAWKKANPELGRPIYGPTFDKLKEAKRKAFDSLAHFARARFREYLTAQGLPDCLAFARSYAGELDGCRAYTFARRLLSTWPQRRADLESQVFEAVKAREAAEA